MPRLSASTSRLIGKRRVLNACAPCDIPIRSTAAALPLAEFAREFTVRTSNTIYKALLLAGCAGTFALATPAMAQNAPAQDEAQSEDNDAPIVVTGSRIQRQDYNATTPTVTVNEALLQQSSTAALETSLNKLPQFVPAQTPTAGGDIQPTATNTPGAATVSLRGIGANRNLVLIDGRRSTPSNASGVTDISTIPAAAIERVEIISGGASATYGADAVAGVTNFILKKNFQGLELDGRVSISQEGDGLEYQFSGIMGTDFPDGRGNISLALSMNTREASFQRDRQWYRDLWDNPNIGGTQFFIAAPGIQFANGNPINSNTFFGIFNQANPSNACNATQPVNPIANGGCSPFTAPIAPAPNGAQGFAIYANPDGSVFTGTDFNQRGGVYRFQGLGQNGYKQTAVGNFGANNEDLYLILPLTRYNAFARGNYEINDWVGMFGQALFSHTSTYTRNEPGPITTGWDVQVPYGNQTYTGDTARGIPSSLNTDGSTNAAYLAGGRYGLNCPATGGCPTYQVFPVTPELQQLLLARQNPNAPFQIQTLMPDPRETFTDVMTYNITAGLEGSIPNTDWTWEAFVNHGESHTFARQTGIYSLARTRAVLTSPNFGYGFNQQGNAESGGFGASTGHCTSGVNFYKVPAGGFSEDCLEAMRADLKNRSKFRQTIVEANFQGGLFDLPGGTVRAAVGASYREQEYEFLNDTLTTQGRSFLDQALGIYPSGDARGYIDSKEVYGELLIPILSDTPFFQEFNLEVGGRYSDYNTTGSSYTYKALADWAVNDWLRFRGGYNRAERAPNIGELFLAAQQTFGVNFAGDPCSTANPLSWSANPANATGAQVQAVCTVLMQQSGNPNAATQYYSGFQNPGTFGFAFPTLVGNRNLIPEKADTWTAGVVIQSPVASGALSRLRLSVDWYDISIKDVIAGQTVASAMRQCFDPALNPLVLTDATAAANTQFCQNVPRNQTGQSGNVFTTYVNTGRVHLQGIDAQLDWGIDIGPGTFTLNSVFNYQINFESSALYPTLPMVDYVGTTGAGENGLNANVFEYRAFTTFGYAFGPAMVSLQWQYYPKLDLPNPPNDGWPSYNLFSLNGSYQLSEDIGLRAGVDNLFNKAPPLGNTNPTANPALGQLSGGSYLGTHDTNGRSFWLGANFRF
jgi:iron complex outermembrane recepter protein